jgi:hypothetical protein
MEYNNSFGQRDMPQLKFKIKIVVFYSSPEDKNMLNELRNGCNTNTCQYNIVPIYIELANDVIPKAIVKRLIKNNVFGYKKDLDRVCLIDSNIIKCDQYILFDSVNSFKIWLQGII